MFRSLLPGLVLVAASCTPYAERDNDEDGVPNGVEEEQGTDVDSADSDGDGLDDAAEADAGTDPLVADSDDDGVDDGAEVTDGTSPLNGYSHKYEEGDYAVGSAGVPAEATGPTGESVQYYDANRDGEDEEYSWVSYQEGDIAENFTLSDEFEQDVDLYSFQGRWIYMTFSAEWCGPCQQAASELPDLLADFSDNMTAIEVLIEDNYGNPPEADVLANWHEEFGLDTVPCLADPTEENWISYDKDWGIPTMVVIDPDMQVVSVDEYVKTADALEALGVPMNE